MNNFMCYFQLLFCIPILLALLKKTCEDITLQPYGPKLCEERCHRNHDCSTHIFDEVQLICRLVVNTSTLNLRSNTERNYAVEASVQKIQTSPKGEVTARYRTPGEEISTLNAPDCSYIDVANLHKACKDDDLNEVKRLVNQGVTNVNCRGKDEMTVIMLAAEHDNEHIFDFLIKHKSDLFVHDVSGANVLHSACAGGNTNIVLKLLTDHNMGIECKMNTGTTPLMVAVYNCKIQVVHLLRARGAHVKAVDKFNNTILHMTCLCCRIDMLKYVLSLNIIDLESRGKYGRTAVMTAVCECGLSYVTLLYQHNSSLTLSDNEGGNVLHLACYVGKLEIVKYLLTLDELRGFEIRKNNFGRTPVQLAIIKSHHEIVNIFRKLKARSLTPEHKN